MVFSPIPGEEEYQLSIRFSSLGSKGLVENLLCCGQGSDPSPAPDVWRKVLSTHTNPHFFFLFFFLVHKPFLGCRDTQPGFGERRVKLSMLQNLLQVGIFWEEFIPIPYCQPHSQLTFMPPGGEMREEDGTKPQKSVLPQICSLVCQTRVCSGFRSQI